MNHLQVILANLLMFSVSTVSYTQIPFSAQIIIEDTLTDGADAVYSADLDGDGDMDVLSASFKDDKIAWYENLSNGVLGPQQIITVSADGAMTLYPADLDNDGDIDVLSASSIDDKIAWYENMGGKTFGTQRVISDSAVGASFLYVADLDGDGDEDVLSASWDDFKIDWYENLGGGTFGTRIVLTTSEFVSGVRSIYVADIDGDDDMDVLSATYFDNKIAWYENQGGGSFGNQQDITTSVQGARYVYSTDLDGDGDTDVLSASTEDAKVAWYENLGGGMFGPQQILSTFTDGACAIYSADLDGDGDEDVLSASYDDNKIAWYENKGGGTFGDQQVITTSTDYPLSVFSADMDNDGDMDVLSASNGDGKIAWYRNEMSPVAEFVADTLSGMLPLTVQFHSQSRGGRTSWLWDFGDGETSNEQNPTHTYVSADTFTVSLAVAGPNGNDEMIKRNYIIVTKPSGVSINGDQILDQFGLNQNYPNPFNPSTVIQYAVKTPCRVALRMYNTSGQELETWVDQYQNAGVYELNIDLQNLPTGVYFYRIDMGGFHDVKKLVKME